MMPDVSFGGLVVVTAVAFAVPLLLGLFPRLRLPSPVVELVAGIVIGPAVLGWVRPDDVPVQVLALIGLAFLLFLAGLEIDLRALRGRLLTFAGAGFAVSLGLALVAGLVLHAAGLAESPLFVAIVLASTALGVVTPVLKDAGEIATPFGQLVIVAASIADFGAVILLTLFFSKEATSGSTRLVLLGAFVALVVVAAIAIARAGRSVRLSDALLRLQDTTAQIRVRGAIVLLIGSVALAERFGLESILGAFVAGAILSLLDRDAMMTHPQFRVKLEAIGFGFLVPVFFISSGVRFDLDALFSSGSTVARVPVFLVALLVVRALPALLYRPMLDGRRVAAAGLLQATSLTFIVAAAEIGMDLGVIGAATGAALIAAGLLSVLVFPLVALGLLGRREEHVDGRTATSSSP
ncbi:MAG: cation:proton antiporter [Actinomycetota bacterium]